MKNIYAALLFSLMPVLTFSQLGSVQGKITDSLNNEEIPIASVILTKRGSNPSDLSSAKSSLSDVEGFFRMEMEAGEYTLLVSNIGYFKKQVDLTIVAGEITFVDIQLAPDAFELDQVVFSESKNSTKIENSTLSISLIKPSMIQARNSTSADMALEQVPGITIVEAEPQIRGASGFSAGLGSKVMILIDDVPMLRGDAGRPVWSFLPMENMDQIEVIKGSGSVLYGSGASNGVINIRTAFPKLKPEFMVSSFFGVYSGPKDKSKKVWDNFPNFKTGINFFHSRVFKGKKVETDFVIGGQMLWDEGYRGGEPLEGNVPGPIDDFDQTRNNEGEYEKSGRMNFNTRFRINGIDGLSFGVNANAQFSSESQSFFWKDTANVYKMLGGSLTNFMVFMYYIDPYVTYVNKKGDKHTFRTRVYQSYSDGDVKSNPMDSLRLGQDSKSTTFYGEYQYSKTWTFPKRLKWLLKDFNIITGIMGTYTYSFGGVFSGNKDGDSSNYSSNFAGYLQLEKKFFSRLTLTAGGRLEYFRINENFNLQPVFRAGTNLRLTEGTFIRASIGQGFRFPTIGERFINTVSAGFGFFSNDSLRPEKSLSAEVGIKQLFKIKKSLIGFIDVAGFWQEYKDYVEFSYGIWPEGTGFRFFNTGRARIRGIDACVYLQANIKDKVTIDLNLGYTWSLPQSLEQDRAFAFYKQQDPISGDSVTIPISYNSSVSDTSLRSKGILKYRVEHMAKGDINVAWKGLNVGFTARYYSTMRQIDNFFANFGVGQVNPFAGLTEYMQKYGFGSWVFDARISYTIKNQYTVAFICENMFNKEYSVRPLGIAPPRLTTLKLTYRM